VDQQHDDTTKYIIAVYRGDFGLPRLEFGSPDTMAKNWPDASAYYMTDNNSCTMVRLEHERKVSYRFGDKTKPTTQNIWRYAESVLQPHLAEYEYIEDRPTWLTDSPEHKDEESYFGALHKQVKGSNNPHISRGDVYASVTIEGEASAPAATTSEEGSIANV